VRMAMPSEAHVSEPVVLDMGDNAVLLFIKLIEAAPIPIKLSGTFTGQDPQLLEMAPWLLFLASYLVRVKDLKRQLPGLKCGGMTRRPDQVAVLLADHYRTWLLEETTGRQLQLGISVIRSFLRARFVWNASDQDVTLDEDE